MEQMCRLVEEQSLLDIMGYLAVKQNLGLYIEVLKQSPRVRSSQATAKGAPAPEQPEKVEEQGQNQTEANTG